MAALHHNPRRVARSRKLDRSEAGDTLVEVLMAIAILGITLTALLGALVTTITSTSEHRTLASLDTVLRSYAEQLKYDVELRPSLNGGPMFTECATVSSATTSPPLYNGNSFTPSNQPPSGYTVVIMGIQYWNTGASPPAFDPVTPTQGPNPCSMTPTDQSGFQLVTLQATAPNGVSQSLSVALSSIGKST